jgi:4-carboxymuconolactone decarboxylase
MVKDQHEAGHPSSYDTGMAVRREVLGDAHVDAVETARTGLDHDFDRFITETAWGSVWSRPGLDRRTRSLVTIGILAALGRREELAMHLRATRNTGTTPQEVAEVLLHVGVYAGILAAHAAMGAAKAEFEGGERSKGVEDAAT